MLVQTKFHFDKISICLTIAIKIYIKSEIQQKYPDNKVHGANMGPTWVRVAHICVSKLNIIGPDNGLSPGQRQAII